MAIEEKSMSELWPVGSPNYGVGILKVKYNISKRFLDYRRFEQVHFVVLQWYFLRCSCSSLLLDTP